MIRAASFCFIMIAATNPCLADPVFNFTFKFKTAGGDGYLASFFTRTDKQIIYSNAGIAKFESGNASFASIKMPFKGGHGCSKHVQSQYVGNDGATYTNNNSTCVTIDREDKDTYYIKETNTAELDTGAVVRTYVAFHLFINGDACSTTADIIWRTFKNSGDLRLPATSVERACQQAKF
jgi:hypothetical protein